MTWTCSGTLKYARATTNTGDNSADWSQIAELDTDVVPSNTSLAVIDGNPAIGYCKWTGFDPRALMYIRSTTSTGNNAADWSQQVTVDDTSEDVGHPASLAFVSGCPAIAYRDYTNDALKYVRATSSTGASPDDWTELETLHSGSHTGAGTTMELVSGNPAIAYRSGNSLKYAYYQQ